MITRWKIGNFKSIRNTVDLPLSPLTIFCGPNSSGKSSIIKSILMVSQSLSSPVWQDPLVLNGKFIHLDYFENILHSGSKNRLLDLGFEIKFSNHEKTEMDIQIEAISDTRVNTEGRLRAIVDFSEMIITDRNETQTISILRKKDIVKNINNLNKNTPKELLELINNGLFDYEIRSPHSSDISSEQNESNLISTSMSNILPGRILYNIKSDLRSLNQDTRILANAILSMSKNRKGVVSPYDRNRKLHNGVIDIFKSINVKINPGNTYLISLNEIIKTISSNTLPITIQYCIDVINNSTHKMDNILDRVIKDIAVRITGRLIRIAELRNIDYDAREFNDLEVQLYPAPYSKAIERVRQFIGSKIFYLGPLRDDPRVMYALPTYVNQRDVGSKGEYTAAMLDMYGKSSIQYPLPPNKNMVLDNNRSLTQQGSLLEATMLWLKHMGLAEQLTATENTRVGYNLTIQPEGLDRGIDLTGVGVGVSQILPTIVMALLAPPGSVLIFEQPEVHLHPKVQSILGDFFLGIIACGKQCLIETHSEHLINRIRRRIAESENTSILDQTDVYFVTREAGESTYQRVKINEFGAIPEWPEGFFDEVEEESSIIMKAALAKRKKNRDNK